MCRCGKLFVGIYRQYVMTYQSLGHPSVPYEGFSFGDAHPFMFRDFHVKYFSLWLLRLPGVCGIQGLRLVLYLLYSEALNRQPEQSPP